MITDWFLALLISFTLWLGFSIVEKKLDKIIQVLEKNEEKNERK